MAEPERRSGATGSDDSLPATPVARHFPVIGEAMAGTKRLGQSTSDAAHGLARAVEDRKGWAAPPDNRELWQARSAAPRYRP